MTITASDIILLFIGLLITGAVGGLTYFLKTQFEKIVDKAGAQSEGDANRVISEIRAAREGREPRHPEADRDPLHRSQHERRGATR